jgi:hypothetical protein
MGKVIDLKKARDAQTKERAEKTGEVDVVEDIRELFRDVVCNRPKLELVEEEKQIDEEDFARLMMKIQSGEAK